MSVSVKKETEQRRSTTSLIILVVGIIFLAIIYVHQSLQLGLLSLRFVIV